MKSGTKRAAGRQVAIEFEQTSDRDEETPTRSRPAAWVVSAVIHALILVFLACYTLANHHPKDQVALAGSVAETDVAEIESVEIETAEMQPQTTEQMPSEVEAEVTDFGEIPISNVVNDLPPMITQPMLDSKQSDYSSAAMSLQSDSDAKIQFCGVEGGGNHFVYLVDSSKSMGDAFESARSELLRSIGLLKPNQRFYVIFFDAESDYMRLESPNREEPRSVYATPENKSALARWARTIQMDRGRAPYDAIPFALELRPDVIFLLSDGEFPQRIEEMLQELNHYSNLFGDEGQISIVHTIGYHSREGESRMLRIAKQNGGQYRYVPKP